MKKNISRNDNNHHLPAVKKILTSKDRQLAKKFNQLSLEQQLELVLDASGPDRLQLLQLSDHFNKLVRAMPAPEVLFTYEEVGAEDALPMLAATSHEQFSFLTDLFCWDKDGIKSDQTIEWLQILVDCGEAKVRDWLNHVDPEWFIVIFKSLVNIYKCDEEGNIPDYLQEKNIFTLDGVYYFECIFPRLTSALQTILTIFRDEHPEGFSGMMEAVIWSDLTEIQEHAAHFRQSRLAEWGFPELDEAVEIYQYFSPTERKKVVQLLESELKEWQEIGVAPRYPIKFQDREGFLANCLQHVRDSHRLARFSRELMLLANKVQIADGMKEPGVLENLLAASKKTSGYVTLGLAELSGSDPVKGAELIGRVHTERLFQVGFSQVQDLAREAKKIVKQFHLTQDADLFNQLGSPDQEILMGLLKPQPKFFIGRQALTVTDYQDFDKPEQIRQCREALERIKTNLNNL